MTAPELVESIKENIGDEGPLEIEVGPEPAGMAVTDAAGRSWDAPSTTSPDRPHQDYMPAFTNRGS